MKTFLNIAYSSGGFWHCIGSPVESAGQSCRKVPFFEVAIAVGTSACLIVVIIVVARRWRNRRRIG